MKSAPLPPNESDRIKSLNEHKLLDTLPEEVYDDITRIATEICGTPIALLTLIDEDRQWFKSKQGVSVSETPREHSFCAHAIVDPGEALIVQDARYDERFHDNPLTTGEPNIVFYAGVPVKDAEGHALGTLCVIDNRPRELAEQKLESLRALAKLINAHFALRKTKLELEENREKLRLAQPLVNTIWEEALTLAKSSPPEVNEHLNNIQRAADILRGSSEA